MLGWSCCPRNIGGIMNGFDALQQLVAEAASTRKMIEQIQASIGYKAMAQQLAEASSISRLLAAGRNRRGCFQRGLRFSRNELMPSRKSAV